MQKSRVYGNLEKLSRLAAIGMYLTDTQISYLWLDQQYGFTGHYRMIVMGWLFAATMTIFSSSVGILFTNMNLTVRIFSKWLEVSKSVKDPQLRNMAKSLQMFAFVLMAGMVLLGYILNIVSNYHTLGSKVPGPTSWCMSLFLAISPDILLVVEWAAGHLRKNNEFVNSRIELAYSDPAD